MKRVIIETPYADNIERNLRYLRACMHDSLMRGEAPFASHGLYTQPGVLRDEVPEERTSGIHAGFAWREVAELTAVYIDLGTSGGMSYGIADAKRIGCAIEYRQLLGAWRVPETCEAAELQDEVTADFGTTDWGSELSASDRDFYDAARLLFTLGDFTALTDHLEKISGK